MKKYAIIVWPILIIILFCAGYFSVHNHNSKNNSLSSIASEVDTQNEVAATELEFTQEDLESYYAIYDDPYVKYLRTALDEYSTGVIKTIDEDAIAKRTDNSVTYGLDSFDKSYYKSKFIVFGMNDNELGGEVINVIFTDIPDRVFASWVYPVGGSEDDLQLRGFYQNSNFDPDKMEKINVQYKEFLSDKEHSI